MQKVLRPSVMRQTEWHKLGERDPNAWRRIRDTVKRRDNFTCVYCGFRAFSFMQVNHIGAEDDHQLENLETVCKPCHEVLHMGMSTSGRLTSIIYTRRLLYAGAGWSQVESLVLEKALKPDTTPLSAGESVAWANKLLHAIPEQEYRGYLPEGMALIFHEGQPWQQFPEGVHRWGKASQG